jgi:hypothetical protein
MSILTEKELKDLKPGDVVFHVNPYDVGKGAEQHLTYETIKVLSNDGEQIRYGDKDYDRHFISDMVRGVKESFSTEKEAIDMVESIKTYGNFTEVEDHHRSCSDWMDDDCSYWVGLE